METAFRSDIGKVRSHNEDCTGVFFNREQTAFAVVADGMGGHLAGDVASSMAVSAFRKLWEDSEGITTPEIAEKWLKSKIEEVNLLLFDHARKNPECSGMGTTFVGAICTRTFATVGHIGDSRCYLLNANGFNQITEDHSLVNELVRSGEITKEDAEHHPRKNVLMRAMGTELSVQVEMKSFCTDEGDALLLCSDGLSNKVSEEEMQYILSADFSLQQSAEKLIELANLNGGEDNISVAMVLMPSGDGEGDGSC
ncbi:Stp1/IreP family PP2C-type Ser/Thr phosphatase [Bacillus sp. FJAT-42376]|uniref:Stp1/IreP family PP2C-type Ser/Thr phosphatase n=1 Tax=Bacillus sp. FJAT-42376 TaxID=2014076 RepID=UPI000F4E41BF|nr:Stp1/IreP family PP2C-type Ser/Thr phosphatase [Bacillus sp. FJAT-42376]AZB42891.1 Stp1/IreP family PP2C-type Ser/Thr phosphatase [Bacillus sp. FJAT-42376]